MLLNELNEKYIKKTEPKAIVKYRSVFLCKLTNDVMSALSLKEINAVYINTPVLKHLYDKKPAEEYQFILDYLHKIVKNPDFIYKNKNSKRGSFCLVKKIKKFYYLSSIEIKGKNIQIVTAFRLRDKKYLRNYNFLWSWEDDETLHRSAFDTQNGSNHTPQ